MDKNTCGTIFCKNEAWTTECWMTQLKSAEIAETELLKRTLAKTYNRQNNR